MSCQSRFDARYWMLGASAQGRPREMVRGGRREEGSGWETCVYLWRIHVDIWQNQYNIVKLKNKIKRRGCGNPPNKDTPRRKTKRQLQWVGRRGAITIISNPRNARWVTHRWENNNTKEIFALLWRLWTPCQASQPGDPTKRLGIPRESGLKGSRIWSLAFPRTKVTRDSSLRGHKQNSASTKTQRREAVTPQEADPKLPASVGGSPVEAWLGQGLTTGMGALEGPPWCKPSSSPLTLHRACRPLRPNNYQGGSAVPPISR